MSCNKCNSTPCSCGCSQSTYCPSPCHGEMKDFACVEYTGTSLPNIDLTKHDTLDELVKGLDLIIGSLQDNSGKVKATDTATCAKSLDQVLTAGANIALTLTGTGCNRQLRIDSITGGTVQDIYTRVSSNDTNSDYLTNKIVTGPYLQKVLSAPGVQTMTLNANIAAMISADITNKLTMGFDGGLYFNGVERVRAAFNDTWNNLVLTGVYPIGVSFLTNTAQWKVTANGTVVFRGYIDFQANFANYVSSNTTWQYTFNLANLFTQMGGYFNSGEISAVDREIASSYKVDVAASTSPSFVQAFGYNTNWSNTNLVLRIYGTYEAAQVKTIRVSFEGVTLQPNI